jgi:uridylate kinase
MLQLLKTSWPIQLAVGAAVLAVVAVGSYAINGNNNASADTENCVTHGEYDQTDVLMSPSDIEFIYDVGGVYVDTPSEDTFARDYRSLCWTDTEEIRVRFDQQSGLSINWNLRDK